jgi:hypothetical protein
MNPLRLRHIALREGFSRQCISYFSAFVLLVSFGSFSERATASPKSFFEKFEWHEVNDGMNSGWEPRAGLAAVNLKNNFYVIGGRIPKQFPIAIGDSEFRNDVWKSEDAGQTWLPASPDGAAPWEARAYFQAVTKGRYMYVIGGQDSLAVPNDCPPVDGDFGAGVGFPPESSFDIPEGAEIPGFPDIPEGVPGDNAGGPPSFPCPAFTLESTFFNDVWRSKDGETWQLMTDDALWSGRAGLSAVTHRGFIYVMGGSFNDDLSIIGPTGPARIYYNDVYRSRDGKNWQRMTESAPWTPRAGSIVVSRGQYMYLLGGEDGFTCQSGERCPPYYNDVWRSKNGKNWELLTADAGWAPRPGHQCEVLLGNFVCFGGFGLSTNPQDPFAAANPIDVWVSRDGRQWDQLAGEAGKPWNAASPEDIKYDLAAFPTYFVNGRFQPSIFTFGGDRETFSPFDPSGFTKVDNDVWQFRYDWSWWRR